MKASTSPLSSPNLDNMGRGLRLLLTYRPLGRSTSHVWLVNVQILWESSHLGVLLMLPRAIISERVSRILMIRQFVYDNPRSLVPQKLSTKLRWLCNHRLMLTSPPRKTLFTSLYRHLLVSPRYHQSPLVERIWSATPGLAR